MKKIITFLVVLAFAGLVLPKFIGSVVETEHQGMLNKMKGNPAFTITKQTFEGGWFTGKAVTKMAVHLQGTDFSDVEFTIEEDLSFGPFIFAQDGFHFALSHSTGNFVFTESEIIDEEIADFIRENIHVSGLLTFSKNVISRMVIDEISKEVDGNNLLSKQVIAEFTLIDEKKLLATLNWGGLVVNGTEQNLKIGKVSMDMDQELISGSFYSVDALSVGDFNFTVDSVNIATADNGAGSVEVLDIKEVLVSGVASVQDESLMDMTLVYRAGEVTSAGQTFKNPNLEVAINNIDIESMKKLNTLLSNVTTAVDENYFAQHQQELLALANEFLAKEPVIEIKDLSVETTDGKIESAVKVTLDKDKFDATNPMSAMAALNANAKAEGPEAFFTKMGLGQMINMYVEQGLLLRNTPNLATKIEFVQGKLTVNGKVIPI